MEWMDIYNQGWSIFALAKRAKRPVKGSTWEPYQTYRADMSVVQQWANNDTNQYNAAIVTGRLSGVVVLDLDNDAMIILADELGYLDGSSVMVKTPRGLHVYYAAPFFELKNAVGGDNWNLPEGMDFRADGGYIVASGSYYVPTAKEREAGKREGRYEWYPGASPRECSLKPVPSALLDVLLGQPTTSEPDSLGAAKTANIAPTIVATTADNQLTSRATSRQQAYALTALAGELERIRTAPRGTSNDTLSKATYTVATFVAAGCLDEHDARAQVTQAALERCRDASEVRGTIASGWKKGMQSPRRNLPTDDTQPPKRSDKKRGGDDQVAMDLGTIPEGARDYVARYTEWRGLSVQYDGTISGAGTVTRYCLDDLQRDLRVYAGEHHLSINVAAINDAAAAWRKAGREARIRWFMDATAYDPAVNPDWSSLVRAVVDCDRHSVDYAVAALQGYIWQIKRRLRGDLAAHDPYMPILQGAQGVGKGTLFNVIHSGLEEFVARPSLAEVIDSRQADLFEMPVLFVEELAGAARSDVAAVKTMVSRSHATYRYGYEQHRQDAPTV